MAQHSEETVTTRDGLQLYAQTWRPDGEASGAVVIVHGFGEHSGRYEHVAGRLVAAGFAVHAYDQRGHGRSEGERAYVTTFRDYLMDLDQFLGSVRAAEAGKPVFLLGHSMGGGVVALYVATRQPEVAGIVLSGAATQPQAGLVNRLLDPTIRLVAKVAPKTPLQALAAADVSRDPEVVTAYEEDELVYHGPLRFGMIAAFGRATRRIRDDAMLIADPILIMHGTEDALVGVDASRTLYEAVSSRDKTLKEYPGLYHEILNEPEQDQVLDDLVAWLYARLPAG
jgi:alpha-beta hydrolase superfamily lysophospholipase